MSRKMRTLVVMGKTTTANEATEITLSNAPPLAAIIAGHLYDASAATGKELTVVSDTPDADGEIQLTATNKFKLYLSTAMADDDILVLQVEVVGERVAVE